MKDARVLLIEDDPNDELLTLTALRDANISSEVQVVRDGEEALNFLSQADKHPSENKPLIPEVILLDLKLPKIDGLDVLKEIRANESTKRVPVVILSSSKEERDVLSGYDYGANSYVVKPIRRAEFEGIIQQLGRYWLHVNRSSGLV